MPYRTKKITKHRPKQAMWQRLRYGQSWSLENIGIKGVSLYLKKSYLTNRNQMEQIGFAKSTR